MMAPGDALVHLYVLKKLFLIFRILTMLSIIFIFLALCAWPCSLLAGETGAPPPPAETILRTYYPLPDQVSLCGAEVPLQDPEVREDLDREFTIVLWNRTQTTMWIKRAARYFPYLEKKLREANLPDDLKYVVLVESDLRLTARSHAGACGPWQFMKPAANRFTLKTDDKIDDRYDLSLATDAALQYFKTLYRTFHNWPLAIAAYNCGEGRIRKAMVEQGVNTYYHLDLPDETDQYVLRVIAAKIIFSDPGRYGYAMPAQGLYSTWQPEQVEFVLTRETPLRQIAEACGSYYKLLRRLNPRLRTATLPPGMYKIYVPAGSASRFHENYLQGQLGRDQGPGISDQGLGGSEQGSGVIEQRSGVNDQKPVVKDHGPGTRERKNKKRSN
jgi:membrane-bound lytic murein transglycosylase D